MNSFSIRFAILNWVHGVRVHIHWPGDVIAVDKVYEAMLISSKGDSIVVELGPDRHMPLASFLVMGKGTLNTNPEIMCSAEIIEALPPPSPPHAIECDLLPKYTVVSAWDTGQSVKVEFRDWSHARKIRIFYRDQVGLKVTTAVNGYGLTMRTIDKGTEMALMLATSCAEAVTNEKGDLVQATGNQMNCIDLRPENHFISYVIQPAPYFPPRISCNGDHPPPPPRPPPPPPPSPPLPPPVYHPPPPPPPSPAVVHADMACPLEGRATRLRAYVDDQGRLAIRTGILLLGWKPGIVVIIGASGYMLDVMDTSGATLASAALDETQANAVLLSFMVDPSSVGLAGGVEFEFTLHGDDATIQSMSCRDAVPSPERVSSSPTSSPPLSTPLISLMMPLSAEENLNMDVIERNTDNNLDRGSTDSADPHTAQAPHMALQPGGSAEGTHATTDSNVAKSNVVQEFSWATMALMLIGFSWVFQRLHSRYPDMASVVLSHLRLRPVQEERVSMVRDAPSKPRSRRKGKTPGSPRKSSRRAAAQAQGDETGGHGEDFDYASSASYSSRGCHSSAHSCSDMSASLRVAV